MSAAADPRRRSFSSPSLLSSQIYLDGFMKRLFHASGWSHSHRAGGGLKIWHLLDVQGVCRCDSFTLLTFFQIKTCTLFPGKISEKSRKMSLKCPSSVEFNIFSLAGGMVVLIAHVMMTLTAERRNRRCWELLSTERRHSHFKENSTSLNLKDALQRNLPSPQAQHQEKK